MNKIHCDTIKSFFNKYRLATYRKGEIIFRPGEEFNTVSFVKTGYVRLYSVTKDGQEITLQIFKPVFYFSLIYAMIGMENKYYFEAITPVEMWTAPKNEAFKFIKGNEEILAAVMDDILRGFMDMVSNVEKIISGNAYNKVATLIYSSSKPVAENPEERIIDFGLTHKMIASLTGLTRETVTLQMLRLEKENLIATRNRRIVVLSQEKMKEVTTLDE